MSEHIQIHRSPCVSCPYRRDVPSGIWDTSEYDKIVPYDQPTSLQPTAVFMCHQADGALCRGWLDCHGQELLAIRLAANKGEVNTDAVMNALVEGPNVQVFESAADAAEHGRADIDAPDDEARRMVHKIMKKRRLVVDQQI